MFLCANTLLFRWIMFSVLFVLSTLVPPHDSQTTRLPSSELSAFNNFSRIRDHLKRNRPVITYYSSDYSLEVKINVTFTVLAISAVKSNPYVLDVEMKIQEEWYDKSFVWDESSFGNISELGKTSSAWFPFLSQGRGNRGSSRFSTSYDSVPRRMGARFPYYSVTSRGRFRYTYERAMVALCEDSDNVGTKQCSIRISYTVNNGAVPTFGKLASPRVLGLGNAVDIKCEFKVEFNVHQGFSQSKFRIMSRRVIQPPGPRLEKASGTFTDEANLILELRENDILAFSEATWPMVCVVASMIALCWREGTSYELFSLRTGLTIFCAVACMLSVDQRLHPRIAHRPYLSWIVGFHVAMSGLVLAEKIYLALRNRFGLPNGKVLPFPGYLGRFLAAIVVLIAIIII